MTQRYYTIEFKLKAVKAYLDNKGEQNISDVARDFGIPRSCMSSWINKYKTLQEFLPNTDPETLDSLKKEIEDLDQAMKGLKKELQIVINARDTLKKAIDIFFKLVNNIDT
jgi:transposase-like protein